MFNLADDRVLRSNGVNYSNKSQNLRSELVSMARDKETLPIARKAALNDLRIRSNLIAKNIDQATNSGRVDEASQVYDYITVGGGVHAGVFNNAISLNNNKLKGLSVEREDLVASNFATDYFKINSTSRQDIVGQKARPGVGNLNRLLGGPVQVPDISTNKYPSGRAISDATLFNFIAQDNDILFKHQIVSVSDSFLDGEAAPARYKILLKDEKGKEKYIYANKIVNTVGLGKENFDFLDKKSRKFVKSEIKKIPRDGKFEDIERDLPKVLTFNAARKLATLSPTPFRPYSGEEVMVVGDGDSGRVAIEWLIREGQDDFYGKDVTQAGTVKGIVWGGARQEDCEDYIINNRVRYASIAAVYKNETLNPLNARITEIKELENGKIKVTSVSRETGVTNTSIVDRVILAAGFKSESSKVYKDIIKRDSMGDKLGAQNPIERSDRVKIINDVVEGESTAIAKKMKKVGGKKQDIYWVGPTVSDIVKLEETAGVRQNTVSIFNNGPRVYSLGEKIADETLTKGYKRLPDNFTKVSEVTLDEDFGKNSIELPKASYRGYERPLPNEDLYLLSKFYNLFDETLFSSQLKDIKLKISVKNDDFLIIKSSKKVKGLQSIADAIKKDPELLELLAKFLDDGVSGANISINLKVDKGNLDIERSSLNFNW